MPKKLNDISAIFNSNRDIDHNYLAPGIAYRLSGASSSGTIFDGLRFDAAISAALRFPIAITRVPSINATVPINVQSACVFGLILTLVCFMYPAKASASWSASCCCIAISGKRAAAVMWNIIINGAIRSAVIGAVVSADAFLPRRGLSSPLSARSL
jgi:hypothetical protein